MLMPMLLPMMMVVMMMVMSMMAVMQFIPERKATGRKRRLQSPKPNPTSTAHLPLPESKLLTADDGDHDDCGDDHGEGVRR